MTKKKLNIVLILFTYLMMIIFGLFESMTGPAIPSIIEAYKTNYTFIGTMLLLCTLAYLVGTLIFGMITDKYGFRMTFLISCVLIIGSALAIKFAGSFIVFIIIFIIMRLGFGGIETGLNSLGAVIFIRSSAILMNIMHLFFGVGSIIGSQLIGRFLSASFEWYSAYSYATIIVIIAVVMLVFLTFPKPDSHIAVKKINILSFLKTDKVIWLIVIALGFSEVLELSTGGWIVNFLQKSQGLSNKDASFYLTMFFVFFSVARLLGGFLAEKVGYIKFVAFSGLLGSACFYIAFAFGGWMNIFYSIAGAPIAMMFPTIMVVLMKNYEQSIGTIMGVVIASAGVIYMLLSQLIGVLADSVSVDISFGIIGISGIICFVCMMLVKKHVHSQDDAHASL